MELLTQGAEAKLYLDSWHGRKVIVKKRISKRYRNPDLDRRLRRERIKIEAKLLAESKAAGVLTPIIYDIDLEECSIVMQFIEGDRLSGILESLPEKLIIELGKDIGRLHKNGILHGDLTTSNVILNEDGLVFIDFGLGEKIATNPKNRSHRNIEERGVDLEVLFECLKAAHSREDLFEYVLAGYGEVCSDIDDVKKRIEEIRRRVRYK